MSPDVEVTVFVKSSDPNQNKETETARYYLPERCRVVALEDVDDVIGRVQPRGEVYVAVGSKRVPAILPLDDLDLTLDRSLYEGLTVYRVVAAQRRGSRKSAASAR